MNVENRLYPDPEQIAELVRPGPDGPIVMVNLLKFRAHAAYPDGRAWRDRRRLRAAPPER